MAVEQQELEQHLWGAANILRGKIDSGEYKSYIFGLLFFKRLSDVWQEEYEERKAIYGDKKTAELADEHRFDIPKEHRWADVRKHSSNIGERLNQAFRLIEDSNTRLNGIFQEVDFNNKERFSDAVLEKLMQHFDQYDLRNSNVDEYMLGNAYEYLIKQFADDGGKKGGEFYTPKKVVQLMVRCLGIDEGMSVYDPTCGSGGMLLEAHNAVKSSGKNPASLSLYGQESNINTWAICQMNLFLHGLDEADIRRGDTLRTPKHMAGEGGERVLGFDRVIANPPFSLNEWGHEIWKVGDQYGRDTYGCPPASKGDLAFVQHMLASLKEDGKLAVVIPHGVLFRGGVEGTIRKAFIERDLVEGVIGLAGNLFYGSNIPTVILLMRKDKPQHLKGKVMVVNGEKQFEAERAQNYLRDNHIEKLANGYLAFKDVAKLARLVSVDEIASNDYNLNINRYVNLGEQAEQVDVAKETELLTELMAERKKAEAKMNKALRELGYVE